MPKKRGIGPAKRRMIIWKMQNFRCAGCGGRAYPHLPWKHPKALTLDEVVPRAKGGLREYGNQIAMHRDCNARKGDRMPTGCELIWLELVNVRLRKRGKLPAE